MYANTALNTVRELQADMQDGLQPKSSANAFSTMTGTMQHCRFSAMTMGAFALTYLANLTFSQVCGNELLGGMSTPYTFGSHTGGEAHARYTCT